MEKEDFEINEINRDELYKQQVEEIIEKGNYIEARIIMEKGTDTPIAQLNGNGKVSIKDMAFMYISLLQMAEQLAQKEPSIKMIAKLFDSTVI